MGGTASDFATLSQKKYNEATGRTRARPATTPGVGGTWKKR